MTTPEIIEWIRLAQSRKLPVAEVGMPRLTQLADEIERQAETIKSLEIDAQTGRDWRADSSLEKWFPLSAETIERQAKRIESLEEAVRLYEFAESSRCMCLVPITKTCPRCHVIKKARAAAEKGKM